MVCSNKPLLVKVKCVWKVPFAFFVSFSVFWNEMMINTYSSDILLCTLYFSMLINLFPPDWDWKSCFGAVICIKCSRLNWHRKEVKLRIQKFLFVNLGTLWITWISSHSCLRLKEILKDNWHDLGLTRNLFVFWILQAVNLSKTLYSCS